MTKFRDRISAAVTTAGLASLLLLVPTVAAHAEDGTGSPEPTLDAVSPSAVTEAETQTQGQPQTEIQTSVEVAPSDLLVAAVDCAPSARTDALTHVRVEAMNGRTELGVWQRIRVDFTGALPEGGCAGDSITVNIPAGLQGFSGTYPVLAADGTVMGTMVVGNQTAVITFNDYIQTHDGITFSGFFTGETTDYLKPGTDYNLEFPVGDEVFIVPVTTGPCGEACESPVGAAKAATLEPGTPGTVFFQLFSPATTAAGDAVVFTDTLGPGQDFRCDSITLRTGTERDAWGNVRYSDTVTAQATIDCDATRDTLTVTATATAAGQYFKLTGRSAVTAERGSYTDTGTVSIAGRTDDVHAIARVQDGGVDGGGTTRVPAIDIEKWSSSEGPIVGDYDSAPGKVLSPTADEAITFTVTNTGTERLVDLVVGDSTTGGVGALTGLSCDFSALGGPSTGTVWEGPFDIGASFTCTAVLPALEADAAHQDTATVIARGMFSDQPVADSDPWNGVTPPAEVPPANDPTSTSDNSPVDTSAPISPAAAPRSPQAGVLALTGSEPMNAAMISGGLVIAGLALWANSWRRRRGAAQH